jgi:cobalt-zinc-cadmium efflux system outer membrane protein
MKNYTFLALAVITFTAQAQEKEERQTLSYEAAVARLNAHPSLEAAREGVLSYKHAALGAGALPDPMVTLGLNNYPADGIGGFDRFAMSSKSIELSQSIPNFGVRASSVEAKEALAAQASIAANYTRAQLVSQLNIAISKQKRIDAQFKLTQEDKKLLQQEAAFWRGRLESGESVLDESSRVDAELAQIEVVYAFLEAEKEESDAELKRLVGTNYSIEMPKLIANPWPSDIPLYMVLMAEKNIQVARANQRGAKSAFSPSYEVGLAYAQRENSGNFDGGDFVSAKVGFTVPIWAKKSQKPKMRAASAAVKQAEAQLRDTQRIWQKKMQTMNAYIKRTILTKKALERKKSSIQTQVLSLQSAYESGGELHRLLAAKRNLIALKMELAELEAEYISRVSQYQSAFQKMPQQAYQTGE